MKRSQIIIGVTATIAVSLALCTRESHTQTDSGPAKADLTGHILLSNPTNHAHPTAAVIWLKPVNQTAGIAAPTPGHFSLIQKNRMFSPHLLVIPAGSVVSFPNADPFFHNVFSLFNGKRFDLGLYEAGSSKDVVFSREGVSYIFCNIHPEMSAVVVSLSTPLYAIADPSERFVVHQVPPGEYELHVWIEGAPQPALDRLIKRVHIRGEGSNTVTVDASNAPQSPGQHLNKFGKPYDRDAGPPY